MLPFLKPRQTTSIVIAKQKPEGSIDEEGASEGSEGLGMAAADLIKAVHAKDADAVAAALKSCIALCDEGSYE